MSALQSIPYPHFPDEVLPIPISWTAGGRVHNWRNHVGERTKAIWNSLTNEQKLAIAADAYDEASAEHWD
jgi:hypothetical protein